MVAILHEFFAQVHQQGLTAMPPDHIVMFKCHEITPGRDSVLNQIKSGLEVRKLQDNGRRETYSLQFEKGRAVAQSDYHGVLFAS